MNKKLISVTVETMDGEEVVIEVNIENKVIHLMRKAAQEIGIEADIRLYDLILGDQRLDPEAKIEQTPIRDGSRVRLERRPRVG